MKDYVIGFLVGFLLMGMLCVTLSGRTSGGDPFRTQVSATLVQWTEADSEELFFEERTLRDFTERPFTVLPPMPRFRPAPPIYNWQLPCP